MNIKISLLRLLIISSLLAFLCTNGNTQDQLIESKFFQKTSFSKKIETLRRNFSKNKIIPKKIELAVLVALSHYPELINERIDFRFKSLNTTMKAQPKANFLFKKRKKRKYVVYLNSKTSISTGLELEELTFNAFVGWLGHELAHIVDYSKKSNWRVIRTGVKYLFSKFKQKYERSIDLITINHGLGYALYEGMNYVYHSEKLSSDYKENLMINYLSLDEIMIASETYEANKNRLE